MIIQVVPANNKHSCTVLTGHDNTSLVLTNNGQCSIVPTGDDQTGNGPTDIVPTGVHLGSILTGNGDTIKWFKYENSTPMIVDYYSDGETRLIRYEAGRYGIHQTPRHGPDFPIKFPQSAYKAICLWE